ncbi:MAG: alanine--tRNA ligase [Candidatus Babeliales bacterium]
MKSSEIRKKFFDFFIKNGHTKVASSSLIPAQDPSLLFTNAGMNQFKDIFLGKETRSYTRAVSIQKCMRAGGKHSDLDNVGFTNRHLTFFEMMGNFSFGDYFKKEAIQFAWDFLTKEMAFDPKNMYATVFREDDEAYDIWLQQIGLPKAQISRLGEADNFWQMGDTGPCGPCTEIYVDRGIEFGCGKISCAPGCDCDRYLEVWNLVFMQYDRQADGSDVPLKQKGVDTGMGLERLCLIVQEKKSLFEIDLFENIINTIENLTNIRYQKATKEQQAAFNVLADHVRSSTFLIADGVTPSNEGRGYVLRKIIRRAALFAQKLTDKNIFPEIAQSVIQEMNSIYPELKPAEKAIKHLLTIEVEKFAQNLIYGQNILERYFEESKDRKIISGAQAFKLYDTFGFPLELTKVIAHEHGFTVDIEGFEKHMEIQRERSGGKITKERFDAIDLEESVKTNFVGYEKLETTSKILSIIYDNQLVKKLNEGESGWIIMQESPFYVEKGGQVSDQGWIQINSTKTPILNLQRIENAIAVQIVAPKTISIDDTVTALVDKKFRLNVMNNHTATHLLQAALIEVLGKEVKQSGSLVHPDYLRFDFTYHGTMTPEQIKIVEDKVNQKIRENIPLNIYYTSYQNAVNKGVIAIFGEKYNPEEVRVIDIPSFSMELCGGTHVQATGDIGCFKITEESALSAGQRRIFAVTGVKAIELFQETFTTVKKLSQEFKVPQHEVLQAVERQQEQFKQTLNTIKKLKKQSWKAQLATWLEQVIKINNIPVGIFAIEDSSAEDLKEIAQALNTQKPGFYFLLSTHDERSSFYCILADQFESQINLKAFATWLKDTFELRGGGKKGTLQGGGPAIDINQLKEGIVAWLKK